MNKVNKLDNYTYEGNIDYILSKIHSTMLKRGLPACFGMIPHYFDLDRPQPFRAKNKKDAEIIFIKMVEEIMTSVDSYADKLSACYHCPGFEKCVKISVLDAIRKTDR